MASTNKHFKLDRTTKRVMETFINPDDRAYFKKAMIAAQLVYEDATVKGSKGWQEEKKSRKDPGDKRKPGRQSISRKKTEEATV